MKDIQDKAKEINDVIDWAEEILFDSDDYSPRRHRLQRLMGQSMTKASGA